MRSLRARLFVGMTVVIVLSGCLSAAFAYYWAYSEAIEIQDSSLDQIATFVRKGSFDSGRPIRGVDSDSEITVIELPRNGCPSADICRLSESADGLRNASLGGRSVRVLVDTRPDGSRFAVAQTASIRQELASGMAFRILLPILATVPGLMIVTAILIERSLRPMTALARDLDSRPAEDLTALAPTGTPDELGPFIASINGLFARLADLIERQKRFVADAAHELRTPVTALTLQVENLDAVSLPPESRRRMLALRSGMKRTKHLLEQMLSLARHDAVGPERRVEPISLDEAVRTAVADLLPAAALRQVDMGFEHFSPVAVAIDAVAIAALVRNVVDNAVRYTPPGGRVDICVYRDGTYAVFQVDDTGPGIPASDLDRIFEPFFRGARPDADGTGLGLAIVKRIVDGAGGSISVRNIDGPPTGLRVLVRLPASEEAAPHEAPPTLPVA